MGSSRRQLLYQITRAKGAVFVARADGKAVGCLVCLTHAARKSSRIFSLAVHPEMQGRGLGRRLLKEAFAYSRSAGMRAITLEVKTENTVAYWLYRTSGFSIVETLPQYYFLGYDAYRMRVELYPSRRSGLIPHLPNGDRL
jgi:ribosomal protein S18 acetylase RimI-like enzyme